MQVPAPGNPTSEVKFFKNKTLGECSVLPCPCPPHVQARAPSILSVPVEALHIKSIHEEAVERPNSNIAKVPVEGPQVAPPQETLSTPVVSPRSPPSPVPFEAPEASPSHAPGPVPSVTSCGAASLPQQDSRSGAIRGPNVGSLGALPRSPPSPVPSEAPVASPSQEPGPVQAVTGCGAARRPQQDSRSGAIQGPNVGILGALPRIPPSPVPSKAPMANPSHEPGSVPLVASRGAARSPQRDSRSGAIHGPNVSYLAARAPPWLPRRTPSPLVPPDVPTQVRSVAATTVPAPGPTPSVVPFNATNLSSLAPALKGAPSLVTVMEPDPSTLPKETPTIINAPAAAPSKIPSGSARKSLHSNPSPSEVTPTVRPSSNEPDTRSPANEGAIARSDLDPPPSDELEALVDDAEKTLQSSKSWGEFVQRSRDPGGDLHQDVCTLPHRAAHLLNRFRIKGAPVPTQSAPWTMQQKRDAIRQGPHQSARQYVIFLRQEYVDMIRKKQWVLLPAHLILGERNLKLSPLGVVPQRDWRPRTISEYSFFGVNDDTIPLSPSEAMQFGRALQRILHAIARSDPRLVPVYLSKINIADGFYRISIRSEDIPSLGCSSRHVMEKSNSLVSRWCYQWDGRNLRPSSQHRPRRWQT
jgi:hypothetical protein